MLRSRSQLRVALRDLGRSASGRRRAEGELLIAPRRREPAGSRRRSACPGPAARVVESGRAEGFDSEIWLSSWLMAPLAELCGGRPLRRFPPSCPRLLLVR